MIWKFRNKLHSKHSHKPQMIFIKDLELMHTKIMKFGAFS